MHKMMASGSDEQRTSASGSGGLVGIGEGLWRCKEHGRGVLVLWGVCRLDETGVAVR